MNWDRFAGDNLIGTEDEIANKVEAALEAGADYVIFYVPGVAYDVDLVSRVEQVTKRFA
jgi:alkanesulfonate monooxygenase SsuD/methylene tetrahydromethanopterin reductase-like flavin-dependent oxidoreductase (luciferase family)